MVTPRPLKLKREVGRAGVTPTAADKPIARVWVDTGVYHLDGFYDYLIPEIFSQAIQVGVRVEVEFGSTNHEAIVIDRLDESSTSTKLKQVVKILSPHVVATKETIDLITQCAKRWAGVPYDFIRSAIPPRVASVDREFGAQFLPSVEPHKAETQLRTFWSLPPSKSHGELIFEFLQKRKSAAQVLIVCSTERELLEISSYIESKYETDTVVRLDANTTRSERYRNFLRMTYGETKIGVGLRGSIFTPLKSSSTIIVVSESSEHLYEPRNPGWNARDVALLRSTHSHFNVVLLGSTPSLEAARLIDTGWLTLISSKRRMNVVAQEQSQGGLLPTKAFSVIRKALAKGPVLALVPRKGYGNAVLCAKCRNIGLCECGGRLKVDSKNAVPSCALCLRSYQSWRCNFCQGSDIYLVARGIDRYVEEIGRAFPNTPILNSSGENITNQIDSRRGIVIATPGAEPKCEGGYAAVALLEGLHFLASSDIRAAERAREQFFSASRLVSGEGAVFVTLDPAHPLVASLARWDATIMLNRELSEQESASLPPYFRFISLELDSKESTVLQAGILQSIKEARLPASTVVRGPHQLMDSTSRITLSAPVGDAAHVVSFVAELQRRRSLSHKSLLRIRVDPYSLA